MSSSSAYGQITGPDDFTGVAVAAYTNGKIVKRTTPNKDGYYMLLYVPEGAYDIVFDAPGFVEKNVSASLLQSQISEVNVKLDKIPAAQIAQPAIIAPSTAQKQSVIEILLVRGSLPLSGQVVDVKTPAGNVEITTGADGKAHVNAVTPGEYIFTYGNITSTTVVAGSTAVPAQKPPVVIPETPAQPATTQQPAGSGLVAGAAIVVIGGAIIALGIILFVASKMIGKQKQKPKADDGKKPAQIEASEKPEPKTEHKHAHVHEANKHAHGHRK